MFNYEGDNEKLKSVYAVEWFTSGGQNIGAVAKAINNNWRVYLGYDLNPLSTEEESILSIMCHGTKLNERIARAIFPEFAAKFTGEYE